jgi:outer membrane autotransporter protein
MPDGSVGGGRFTTAGLSAGVDWRVHSDLVVGAAVGYGSDRATVGSLGTSSNSTSFSGALYASYSAFDPWFIDATVGYGQLGYDNRRYVTDDATTVTGSRKGAYWFGAATVGYEFKYRGIHVSPYVRADFMQAQLDSYAEQGASSQALSFAAMKFHSLGGTAGLRGSYDIPMSWGVLTPNARVEYRATIDGAFQQSMNFTDIGPSVSSTLVGAGTTTGTINTSLGVRARSLRGISGELEYGTSSGAGKVQSQTIRAGLKVPF